VRKSRRLIWGLAFVGWVLVGLTFGLNDYLFSEVYLRFYKEPLSLASILWWELVYWPMWAAMSPLIFQIARRFPVDRGSRFRNVAVNLLAGPLITVTHRAAYLFVAWLIYVASKEPLDSIFDLYHHLFFFNLPTGFMSYGVILLVSHVINYYQRFRDEEVKASRLKAELAEAQLQITRAQLESLKMQLHPHFLFNTLNSISALLDEDVGAADEMLARLGDFLRLTLENSGAQTVALREELEFLRRYLEIEQVRYQDRLGVDMKIEPETLEAEVPNMILQPIIENAIRHGTSQRLNSGRIEVRAAREGDLLRLDVQDNGPGLTGNGPAKAGVGLSNTRARLHQSYGAAHSFAIREAPEGGTVVTLEIPFTRSGE
jgi:two-component system, LytTR family, sensor kinase